VPVDDDATQPTYEHPVLPWLRVDDSSLPTTLHLVVASFLKEPERIGSAAPIVETSWLGRGQARADDVEVPLVFWQQRPEVSTELPRIETRDVSRRQLTFTPVGVGEVRVDCVGRRALLHDGRPVRSCVARAGDTLMLADVAVFLLERRLEMPEVQYHRAEPFGFGRPFRRGAGRSTALPHQRDPRDARLVLRRRRDQRRRRPAGGAGPGARERLLAGRARARPGRVRGRSPIATVAASMGSAASTWR
jgi:hypothetical protein